VKLNELHDILYDILCAIDDACKKENVPYMLDGGTLIGAVRHRGFIPWDDDVDICIWRKDYPALQDALKKHLPSHLQLITPADLSPNFHDFVIRVQDTRYYWHHETEEDRFYDNKQNHVCVDIFLVDYSANTLLGQKLRALQVKVVYGLAMGHRFRIKNEKYSWQQKLQTGVLSAIGKRMSMETILRLYDAVCDGMSKKEKKYCIEFNCIPKNLEIPYESAWFKGTKEMQFSNTMLPVQLGYHEKLTTLYGDYMKPPKDKNEYIIHIDEGMLEDEND